MRRSILRQLIEIAAVCGLLFLVGCSKNEQDAKETTPEKQDQAIKDNPDMSPEAKAQALKSRENGRANAEAMRQNPPPKK